MLKLFKAGFWLVVWLDVFIIHQLDYFFSESHSNSNHQCYHFAILKMYYDFFFFYCLCCFNLFQETEYYNDLDHYYLYNKIDKAKEEKMLWQIAAFCKKRRGRNLGIAGVSVENVTRGRGGLPPPCWVLVVFCCLLFPNRWFTVWFI